MRGSILSCSVALLLTGTVIVAPALSAGGSAKTETMNPDRMSAADRLYNKALVHIEKGRTYEAQARGISQAKEHAVYTSSARREYELAAASLEEATKQYSRHFEAFGSLGYAYRRLGQVERSLAAYDRSLKINPDYARAREYRAEAYLQMGDIASAKQDYLRLAGSHPEEQIALLAAMRDWLASSPEAKAADPHGERVDAFRVWVESEIAKAGPVKRSW